MVITIVLFLVKWYIVGNRLHFYWHTCTIN